MRNRTAPETIIQKTPDPTPARASEELPDVGVRSVEPSSTVVDAAERSLLVAEVVVGNCVVPVTGSFAALRTTVVVVVEPVELVVVVVVGAAVVVVVDDWVLVVVVVARG